MSRSARVERSLSSSAQPPWCSLRSVDGPPVGSSGEVQLRYAAVSVWEDGKVVRMTKYTDIDAATERLAKERA
jgi:hypothetical protein